MARRRPGGRGKRRPARGLESGGARPFAAPGDIGSSLCHSSRRVRGCQQLSGRSRSIALGVALRHEPKRVIGLAMTAELPQRLCPKQEACPSLSTKSVVGCLATKALCLDPIATRGRHTRTHEEGVAPARESSGDALALAQCTLGVLDATLGEKRRGAGEVKFRLVGLGQPMWLHHGAEVECLRAPPTVRGYPRTLLQQARSGYGEQPASSVERSQPGLGGVPSANVVLSFSQVDLDQTEALALERVPRCGRRRFSAKSRLVSARADQDIDRSVSIPGRDAWLQETRLH